MVTFDVSQRRACSVIGQPRSTQRLPRAAPAEPEQHLRARLRQLAQDNPRYGYRRLHALLVREGHTVNHKRIQRLCRDEGLRVRVSRRKRARVGTSTTPGDRLQAVFPNHVWALDFAFDQTADGRVLKVLTVTDEFTKTALAIEVERSITGDDLVRVLDRLVAVHGCPQFIRMDNGPEMTCNAIADWCRFSSTGSVFIEPGSPWQNPFVESFNGKLRDELLAIELFHSLLEAKVMAEDYRQHYNTYRPHSSLGYRTPNEFTLDWNNNNPGLAKTLAH
jgi:putative transposase